MSESNDFNQNEESIRREALEESQYTNASQADDSATIHNIDQSASQINQDTSSYAYETNPVYQTQEINKKTAKKSGWPKFVAGVTIASLIGGTAIGSSFAFVSAKMDKGSGLVVEQAVTGNGADGMVQPIATNNTITDIANNLGPSVVSIYNTKVVSTFLGNYDESGLGSGVIFKEDSEKIYMVTNCHVVEGATSLAVNFLGNTKVEGELIGKDVTTDLAVVAVQKANLNTETLSAIRVAKLGNSDKVQVGQLAVAIGTPMEAAFNNTVTVGVISAINREVQVDASRTMTLLQTDAAINPGNSGGALVGPTGEIIGINTIKMVDSSVEGMGFAIPMNTVKPVIEEIIQNGTIERPTLGIMGSNVSSDAAQMYELPIGVYVAQVTPGGSADVAGIQAGDILFEFDGTQITDMNQLKSLIGNKRVGDKVEVKVVRNKEKENSSFDFKSNTTSKCTI
ncbi:S1C family serine protease [Cellulosilyticum ruminicola]|uniref:S1C family serine protease n=1 Tax=Cellulosilyticum ruminicola TaxID=425254 RepID=UPI0006D1EDB3|nr:trypsin-like peptidase domain-containing protein [Cellulosilyticum ruminicola]